MEINYIKIQKATFNVIFTGEKYLFLNSFFGLVCVAFRDYNKEDGNNSFFTLYVGNENCKGGSFTNSVILCAAKRFITKNENKYIYKKMSFAEVEKDLRSTSININLSNF